MTRPSRGEMLVGAERLGLPGLAGGVVERLQAVGRGLVGAHDTEVTALGGGLHDRFQQPAQHPGRLVQLAAALVDLHRVPLQRRDGQIAQQQTAIGVRRGAQPARPLGHTGEDLAVSAGPRRRTARRAGTSAASPPAAADARAFSRTPGSGTWWARQVPSTGCPSTSCGPVQPLGVRSTIMGQRGRSVTPSLRARRWMAAIRSSALSMAAASRLVDRRRIVAGDMDRVMAVAAQQRIQLVLRNPGEHRRVGDLVAVEMQQRQHRAVVHRVQELRGVPGRGERPGLRLAVADHTGDEQLRVVERRAVGMGQGVAQLAALMDRARGLRRDMAGHPAGERELPEQPGHALRRPG